MIRRDLQPELLRAATEIPAITLTGPRQSGKTTLCQTTFPEHAYVTLEDPDQRAFATDDPRRFLSRLSGGAILDEVQRVPDILSYLQGHIDADPVPGRWILCGSHSFSLHQSISQTLAGRTYVHQLLPLSWNEICRFSDHPATLEDAVFKGGYPRIHDRGLHPSRWLRSYVATYLERDVRLLINLTEIETFQRFVALCAGRTGQLLNFTSLANDCGISQPTVKAWFGILEASYVVFRLPAFARTLNKRLVRRPKLYFHDTGFACWLLGVRDPEQLMTHPLRGAIFETWVVSEILKHRMHGAATDGLFFYRDRNGQEVDLVIENSRQLILVEAKSGATPSSKLFRSADAPSKALHANGFDTETIIVYGGDETQERHAGKLVPWRQLHKETDLFGRDHEA